MILLGIIELVFMMPLVNGLAYAAYVPVQASNAFASLPLLCLLIYLVSLYPERIRLKKFEYMYILFVLFLLLLGMFNGFSIVFILKDLMILTLGPMAFVLGREIARIGTVGEGRFIKMLTLTGIFLSVFMAFGFLMSIIHLLIFFDKRFTIRETFLFLSLILTLVLTASKSFLIVLLIWFFLVRIRLIKKIKILFSLAVISFVVLLGFDFFGIEIAVVRKVRIFLDVFSFDLLFFVIASMNPENVWLFDKSTGQRLYEFMLVLQSLDLQSLIMGHGLGFGVDLSGTQDKSIEGRLMDASSVTNVRSFHLMVTWVLAKAGLLGFLFLFLYLRFVWRLIKGDSRLTILFALYVGYSLITFGGFGLHYAYLFIMGFLSYSFKKRKAIFESVVLAQKSSKSER